RAPTPATAGSWPSSRGMAYLSRPLRATWTPPGGLPSRRRASASFAGVRSSGGDLLVGNFGDGRINAFDPKGRFVGTLADGSGKPITIENLWALRFGNGGAAGSANTLFFTAGLTDAPATIFGATDGLLGSLQAIPPLNRKAPILAHIQNGLVQTFSTVPTT